MQLYKVSIKLKSALATPLKGDTIWGHIVWGIANHEGDDAVSNFLEEEKSATPSLIVSSAFPKGTICKPFPKHEDRKPKLSTEEYSKIKKSKKEKFVSAAKYFSGFSENEPKSFRFEQIQAMHNSINRFSNTVEEGNLFTVEELWASRQDFDLYVLSSYSKERISQFLDWAFENGYGADSSTGKGKISAENIIPVQPKISSNKYVALAPFVTDFSEIKENSLRANTFIRTGKIGGAFASSMSPYKKTVILFDEGAVFESEMPLQFIGKLITKVHSDGRICQSGFAPVLPIGDDE
ncbi:MAG: CRISPR-associated protein Csm4 [Spirochaetales bacterium]|nr:CRISPR-associated protein Csm4 [Spirochaetales bacterium]